MEVSLYLLLVPNLSKLFWGVHIVWKENIRCEVDTFLLVWKVLFLLNKNQVSYRFYFFSGTIQYFQEIYVIEVFN